MAKDRRRLPWLRSCELPVCGPDFTPLPILSRINERIQINGEQISDDDFALLHELVERTVERLVSEGELPWHPSFFEMLTAMAFEHFARRKVTSQFSK